VLLKQVEEFKRVGPVELPESLRFSIGAELLTAMLFDYLTCMSGA
jgi:hypothetical protein